MDNPLVILALFVFAFLIVDLVALRFGADSRQSGGERRDW